MLYLWFDGNRESGNIKRLNLGVDLERAYKKGDVFEVLSTFDKDYVVYHPIIKTSMSVSMEHFITISEWRDNQLNKIGI